MSHQVSRRQMVVGALSGAAVCEARAQSLAAPSTRSAADAQLRALLADNAEADAALDPMGARRRGDRRARGFVDPLSDTYADALLATRSGAMRRLKAIDRAGLGPVDRLAYDVLRYQTRETLDDFASGVFAIRRMTHLDPSFGLQVEFADAASGASMGPPFKTVQAYEDGLARLHGFGGYMRSAVSRLQEGRAAGYLQPKVLVRNVIVQVDAMLALQPQDTPFFEPLKAMPAEIAPADKVRLQAAYEQVIETEVLAGYRLWKTYLSDIYLPYARDRPGLCAMKDGDKVYAAALRHHTTTDLSPEDIQRLGLSEVARIRGELEAVRRTLGYPGDLHALFEHVRTDRTFYYSSPDAFLARMKAIEAKIWLGIPRLFDRRPTAPFEIRALPSMGEARGTGYYQLGPPDGRSPGVLYFNMSMLGTRPIPTLETLTLHEGIPGHHFQGSLAQENTALPDILRFGQDQFTAYAEGWGLYSESLGKALGMFTDPYQWFGHLDFEMLRATRLVIDTGLHAKGWSREQARAFMTDNTSMAAKDIGVEIDRYIAAPGQATAYKVGELKLLELRTRAQSSLGRGFDIRRYHDQVLMTGALPLDVLETKIEGWIAAGGPAYSA